MSALTALIWRNTRLFFQDRGLFFTSLITPLILLVLYATFLSNVYEGIFRGALAAANAVASDALVGGCVRGQLVSSLLAVSCVTVAFCSNVLMVQDKVSGARQDLILTSVRGSVLALGYYLSTLLSTLLVSGVALAAGLAYVAGAGWYLSAADVLGLVLDVLLLTLFGTALSSLINHFLTSQGQISAVGTVISAGYGFLCGAYMPISQFSEGLQKAISLLPGTYGTSLLRNHMLRGVFDEMSRQGFPDPVVAAIRDSVDCNLYFFGAPVSISAMYGVVCGAVAALIVAYVAVNARTRRRQGR